MIDPNSPIYCKIQPAEDCMNDTFYEVGETYTQEGEPIIDLNGFHCCSNFFECFQYYGSANGNENDHRFFKVQLGTNVSKYDHLFCGNEMLVVEEWSHKKVVESITEEMCLEALSVKGCLLHFIPENAKTPKMCFVAVSNHGWALDYVPKHMKTPEICIKAVSKFCWALEYVPENMKTPEICFAALLDCGSALQWVPEHLLTPEMRGVASSKD